MRITSIETVPIAVPTAARRSALGTFDHFEYGIVRVRTDEGIEGLGEISTLWDGQGRTQCALVDHHITPRLVGEDPTAINLCLRRMDTLVEGGWPARAGVEMALWDILGKSLDVPLWVLLGGRSREGAVLSRSIHMASPEEMAAQAKGLVADGYGCVKVKIGVGGPGADEAAVAAVREAVGPDVIVRVDANMGWRTPKDAIRSIRRLERYDLHSVEEPLPPGDVEALALVRRSVDTPIMADESVWGPRDAWNLLKAGAVDILNVYVAESGGLTNASLIFRMAETVGVPCVIGAMPELGIGTSAGVHLAVAMTNLHDPCDASGALYHSSPDVVKERFRVEGGVIHPLEGPGLGVTLDEDVLDGYRMT